MIHHPIHTRGDTTFHIRDAQDIVGIDELWGTADPYGIRGRDPHTVIDIGGNIGLFTMLICHLYPDAHVFTYEAWQPNYEVLVRNIERWWGRAIAYNLAIWSDNNGVAMKQHPDNYGCTSVDRTAPEPTVPSIRLDTILNGPVDILKIDTEGSEYEILMGATRLDQVGYLCMELHDWFGDDPRRRLHDKISETHDIAIHDWIPGQGAHWLCTRR